MQKIMFNDRYGLTRAVLEGRKTMTRRPISERVFKKASAYRCEYFNDTLDAISTEDALLEFSRLKVGDVVAVAQPYKDVIYTGGLPHPLVAKPGWTNKMFVRADLMPHQIRITDVRVERLQDISDEDCLREGISKSSAPGQYYVDGLQRPRHNDGVLRSFTSPHDAFAALIDKVSSKGTWQANPYCFCYTFELIR